MEPAPETSKSTVQQNTSNTKYLRKDAFAVIGKAAEGPASEPHRWIVPLWKDAHAHFAEIADAIRKDESGAPVWWGAMNDATESNKRWGDNGGKYMAGCEADVEAVVPKGWTKWIIPAQTYLVAACRMDHTYGETFAKVTNDPSVKIIGAIHERYPDPADPGAVELYFPVAEGASKAAIEKSSIQAVRIVEIPDCKMVSSGLGMFGEEKFERFGKWFASLPPTIHSKDYLTTSYDEKGVFKGMVWYYLHEEGMDVPAEFEVVDFKGGLHAVSTGIDQRTDIAVMDAAVDAFLRDNNLERDPSRPRAGHVITPPSAREALGFEQMDYFAPVKPRILRVVSP